MTQTQSDFVEYISLDYGSKHIGVARINTAVRIAEALAPIDNSRDVISQISSVINEHKSTGLVIGLPRGLDGQETDQTNEAKAFAEDVKSAVDIPVFMIDEAGSSAKAQERIGTDKTSLDSAAAGVIAEDFVAFSDKDSLRI